MKLCCHNCGQSVHGFYTVKLTGAVDKNDLPKAVEGRPLNEVELLRCATCGMTDHKSSFVDGF